MDERVVRTNSGSFSAVFGGLWVRPSTCLSRSQRMGSITIVAAIPPLRVVTVLAGLVCKRLPPTKRIG